jgi:hypothetical protein
MASKIVSLVSLAALAGLVSVLGAACAADPQSKEEVVDETTQELTSGQTRIAGSLTYGQTSNVTQYRRTPRRYTAYKFSGAAGDKVEIRVTSSNGEPVTWLLDNDWNVIARNDDAASWDTNSTIKATLPANASNTRYIVVREYWLDNMTFRVKLTGESGDFAAGCNVDADCEKVTTDCCGLARPMIAVKASNVAAFKASLNCPDLLACPAVMPPEDHGMAQCNFTTHKCENVQPKDIVCGGYSPNPHACPPLYNCRTNPMIADAPGKCVQICGGFAGFQCSDPNETCIDDPTDSCDPQNGGADCMGMCVLQNNPPNCNVTGCASGQFCSFCWGNWACIPQGARC